MLERHVTVLSEAFDGATVAVNWPDSPFFNDNDDGEIVTDDTGTKAETTVTVTDDDLPPAEAVIVAEPAFFAITLPEASTVATAASDDFHDT
ncbi:hypothetical protein BIFGAL_04468, partial [Bifidobacterium gallicum DSM 20093 = LMG 11596]